MIPFRLALIAIALAITGLAACGDGDERPPPQGAPRSTPTAAPSPVAPGQVRITYLGHSMFTIESPGGVVILTDPNDGIGYTRPNEGSMSSP